jgi:ABC-2 type transport system ATP-binding protein
MPDENVIQISDLSRRFGAKEVLNGLSLAVPRGSVFGLVGENGAGKSTLIKHILGLFRPQGGTVRIFGLDPVAEPVSVLERVGYLSEQPDLPGWMTVAELLRYTAAFYPNWDEAYAEQLRQAMGLDGNARIKTLSKGQVAKAGLLAAQAHRPDLLLLDEPSSGLDPIVRSDILAAVIGTVAEEGRTVFFSSHLLEEIERVSDYVAMLHRGKIILCGPIDEVRQRHRRVTLCFPTPQSRQPNVPAALSVSGSGREWAVICNTAQTEIYAAAAHLGATITADREATLNELFMAYAA